MTETQPKIIFILGTSRTGSTLLDNILGQIDGFLSVGELRFLWRRILQERRCGCGTPIARCPLWSRVLAEVSAELGDELTDASRVVALQQQTVKLRKTLSVLRERHGDLAPDAPLARYRDLMRATYRSLARTTGTRVIVDSSKFSPGAALLHLMPDIDYYFVHLVRDARGVSFSEMSKKVNPDWPGLAYMPRAGTGFTILAWLVTNVAAELTRRSHRPECTLLLRYEDFVEDAESAVRNILAMVGAPPRPLPFVSRDEVRLRRNHTVAGNPSRFVTGSVKLRPDNRWTTQLPPMRRALTTGACLPLLLRYHYPIFRGVADHEQSPISD